MQVRWLGWALPMAFLASAGCGGGDNSASFPPGESPAEDAQSDVSADAQNDVSLPDAPADQSKPKDAVTEQVDAGPESASDAAQEADAPGCTGDQDCSGNTPHCDIGTGLCKECVGDEQCPLGELCEGWQCKPGCNEDHGCGDAGACDFDAGQCKTCASDADCSGETPRCDPVSHACVVCLPTNDNCQSGYHCLHSNGKYSCALGCKVDLECQEDAGDGGSMLLCCDGVCVDTQSDSNNCAGCGHACSAQQYCCAGACVDPLLDPANCGDCGKQCSLLHAVPGCADGACTVKSCESGWGNCDGLSKDGCEVSTQASVVNCGSCGNKCNVPHATPACSNGVCGVGTCLNGFGDCNADATDGCEHDIYTDPLNCGSCDLACKLQHASPSCTSGICTIKACDSSWADCDLDPDNGCEVGKLVDPENCGVCGNACVLDHATASCVAGSCAIDSCAGTWADCDKDPLTGCEADTSADVAHCGGCQTECSLAHAAALCLSGMCAVGMCTTGWANCNGQASDGCEADTLNDVAHCGQCSKVCESVPYGTAGCSAGACAVASCAPGHGDCDNTFANGCEVSTGQDVNNCGACGQKCDSLPNATTACVNGACAVGMCTAPFADCDNKVFNGCEVNTAQNVENCGGCGKGCATPANGTAGCVGSVCVVASCLAGHANCDNVVSNGCEVNTYTSSSNCGGCGIQCPAVTNGTPGCAAGACGVGSCNLNYGNCDGISTNGCEIYLPTDTSNCGTCGNKCAVPANATVGCSQGACGIGACLPGFANCDTDTQNGCEANLNSLANCGSCGHACELPNANQACSGGSCVISSCVTGYGNCDGGTLNGCETNLFASLENCGTCGKVCSLAHATPACMGGSCVVQSCNSGWGNCDNGDANGCEVDLSASLANCGTCGHLCVLAHATTQCSSGACQISSCNSGYGDCDNSQATGCETNTNTSTDHCGECGNPCVVANATPVCSNGTCAVGTCLSGFADCDNNPLTGCEVNTNSNSNNCGTCGHKCNLSQATSACSMGSCEVTGCLSGFGNCDGVAANGCETDLSSNVVHCGDCSNVCDLANASESCVGGTCAIGACDGGFGNCDGLASSGCETNLLTNPTHCGGCNQTCYLANAVAGCAAGGCVVASCVGSYGNCDGFASTGCETDLNSSVLNCGSCGNQCNLPHATEQCVGGSCLISACEAGYQNCDTLQGNGCEINTATDPQNCGLCGNACALAHASVGCAAGACTLASCTAGYLNCDGQISTGCETSYLNDPNNCGSCGHVCALDHANSTCSNGSCVIVACESGFSNCDGVTSNGCEADLANSSTNCGTCGNVCSTGMCGNTITASMGSTPANWNFNGNALYDSGSHVGVLTPYATYRAGTIVYAHPIVTDSFVASFEFLISGTERADGMGFMIQTTGATAVGPSGGGLGIVGLGGYGAEYDIYQSTGSCADANNNHAAVVSLTSCGGLPTHLSASGNLTTLIGKDIGDSTWHTSIVSVTNGVMSISIDGSSVLSNISLTGIVLGTKYYYGFGGGTGGLRKLQEVRNVVVTFPTSRCL